MTLKDVEFHWVKKSSCHKYDIQTIIHHPDHRYTKVMVYRLQDSKSWKTSSRWAPSQKGRSPLPPRRERVLLKTNNRTVTNRTLYVRDKSIDVVRLASLFEKQYKKKKQQRNKEFRLLFRENVPFSGSPIRLSANLTISGRSYRRSLPLCSVAGGGVESDLKIDDLRSKND